ncbi:group II intron reverse transcriptase/maturase [Escherichia coli]|uniref:RNA-directed DNA polymerase n=1 Tax=Escherichia coli TaxID=562 RepID=A0A0L7AFF5_ECOLX|nr:MULTISPECIES: group II intron reverse transcriptase/maturase [Escherichia]EHQ5577553.1 group II intron reverse transcriptase/maturase [Escherichia coli O2]EGB63756.1 reverse transcriptase [Escherichia coli M863]EGE64717.1 maturase-related protein [Escherichia coli STEC_7v]EGO6587839.1 group II intron reverse transcriptase/maturase [Escherichia coli]EGO7492849.1 group II intron reverse transcriptase/maturase [Escherichia coli]
MTPDRTLRQKPGKPGRIVGSEGEARAVSSRDEALSASHDPEGLGRADLLQQVLSRENMVEAWKRVKANKGSAGADGLTIEQTVEHLKTRWPYIREALLNGTYRPQPVRRVEIPKPTGGTRELGIPTVTDRLIQQALLQVLQPLIDPTFSEFSYGFRPGRSAHDAVLQAQRYAQDGFRVVVDVDLEKFFDRVNHDILMDRLARRIADKAVLRLIRRYLQAGIMADGVVMARDEGTPQGGPLSPLLANVLLDEVDRALQQRGHRFARYADDCNVYVRSQKAGERVLRWMRKMYEQLHLRVNEKKTEVGPVFGRKFLGYCLRRWSGNTVKIAVAPKALDTFKRRIRLITRRVGGQGITQIAEQMRIYLRGWKSYFRLAQTPKIFKDLDSWIRHRLRAIQLKHWRTGTTVYNRLRSLGATHEQAALMAGGAGHWWRHSEAGLNRILTVDYFDALGLPRLA